MVLTVLVGPSFDSIGNLLFYFSLAPRLDETKKKKFCQHWTQLAFVAHLLEEYDV